MKTCWDNIENIYFDGKYFHINNKLIFYRENCLYCKDEFFAATRKTNFCCQSHSELNKPPKSKKHKEKISMSNIGKHNIKHSYKTKINISNSHKGLHKGKLNNSWKGGVKKKNIPIYDTYAEQIMYAEPVRRSFKNQNILEVKCAYCGKWYIPKRTDIWSRIQSLNGNQFGEARLYCSNECKQECTIYKQIKHPKGYKQASYREVQPELRQLVFERDNWKCQKCRSTKSLHCHHVEGIRHDPLESADIDKYITYCKKCHKEAHKKEDCGYQDMQCKEKLLVL